MAKDIEVNIPQSDFPRIVVIGAGFAGVHFIKKMKNKPFQIVLIDRNNFHQFQPLFYQVATSGLEPDSIIFSLRKTFQNYDNFVFRMAEVEKIDRTIDTIKTSIGNIKYDHLIIASGSTNNFYGMADVEANSIGLKTIQESLDIRSHILQNLEKAVNVSDEKERQKFATIVIVGGGPAGIEMAGAMAEFKRFIFSKDYPDLDADMLKVYLVEASDKLLGAMSDKSADDSYKYLTDMAVNVLLKTAVKKYNGTSMELSNGESIDAATLIWTAGVKGQFPEGLPPTCVQRGNRIQVDRFSLMMDSTNIYALGDVAYMETDKYPQGHPMVAPTAIQQGEHLANNFITQKWIPFVYFDKGALATIGKKKAVADINKKHFRGFFAWLIWSLVHLMSISGFKNKLRVGLSWTASYFSYDKSNRFIIRKFKD